MRLNSPVLLMLPMLSLSSTVHAFFLPSFGLDGCAWNATCIVVATEGQKIDGRVRVLECWLGDVQRGEEIRLKDLASYALENRRTVREHSRTTGEVVTCSRMVLFLRRTKNGWEGAAGKKPFEGILVSTVWIEKRLAYWMAQTRMSGPQVLVRGYLASGRATESKVRHRVLEILKVRRAFNEARSIPRLDRRAQAMIPFVRGDVPPARSEALGCLVAAGEPARPVLLTLLRDAPPSASVPGLIAALEKLDAKEAGSVATDLLKQELEYWKKNAGKITSRALHGGEWLDRHDKLTYILEGLARLAYPECEETVRDALKYWNTRTDLNSSQARVIRKCDAVLKRLADSQE